MEGINGKLLNVDLTMKKTWVEDIPETDFRKYLGGSGLGAKLIMERANLAGAPLDAGSPLIVMTGILTGTGSPTGCKASICAKSPQTGIWNEGTVGGYWPTALKRTGFDGVYITGKAEEPVYLFIEDGKVYIKSAQHIWGKDTFTTDMLLRQETQQKARVGCIGLAGENLSAMAGFMVDGTHPRTAGRGGIGAVIGAKNLKAIVVHGTRKINIFNREGLLESVKAINPTIREKTKGLTLFGTAGGIMATEASGDLPIKNFYEGNWAEGAKKTCGQAMAENMVIGHHACFACPIRCAKTVKIAIEGYQNIEINHPEYETAGGFGANCLNDNPEVVALANHLCNAYGLDTISVSVTIGFAMEAFEKGLITLADTQGLDLSWGNKEAIIELIHAMAKAQGIGKLLMHGTRYAAEQLGARAREFAIHAKGMELPMHDPRCFSSMALNYATANRGGCHLESLGYSIETGILIPDMGISKKFAPHPDHPEEDLADMTVKMQNLMQVFNALGICKFANRGGVGPYLLTQWINQVTGWDMTTEELMKAGERLFNLKRLYNNCLGITRKDDTLPPRMLNFPRPSGGAKGKLPYLGKMLYAYYGLRQWTEDGVPQVDKLRELGLEWIAIKQSIYLPELKALQEPVKR